MRRLVKLGISALCVFSAPANACEITNLLSGRSEAATVTNKWDGDTYSTFLIRNAERNAEGTLNNWIKFELIPQRWGFDLELPNGRRFAQINKEGDKWVVSPSPGFIDACSDNYVTLKKLSASKMGVYDRLKLIGEIDDFPFGELF